MRIGVVSDTHMPVRAKKLPEALIKGLKSVDLILHAGDWVSLEAVALLEQLAPVDGIAGNNDGEEVLQRFGRKKILTLAGYRIGIIHGDGFEKTTEQRAFAAFRREELDVIIFGHSHIPLKKQQQGVLMFNPGSPTDKRRQPLYSYGILELNGNIKGSHFFYEDKS